jgi:hypothetical protein
MSILSRKDNILNSIDLKIERGSFCKASIFNDNIKVFDTTNKVVAKYFGDKYPKELIKNEVEKITQTLCIKFAPRLISSNIDERWYKEQLIEGNELWPKTWLEVTTIYQDYIFDIVIDIIKSNRIINIDAVDYATKMFKTIVNKAKYSSTVTIKDYNYIVQYSNEILSQINSDYSKNIYLSYVHGDFKFSHIIVEDNNEAKVIDWETYGRRSLLFDFFNPLGPWMIHNISTIDNDMKRIYEDIVNQFEIKIESEFGHEFSNEVFSNIDLYRNIYHLDRLARIVEINDIIDTSLINNMFRVIAGSERIDDLSLLFKKN